MKLVAQECQEGDSEDDTHLGCTMFMKAYRDEFEQNRG